MSFWKNVDFEIKFRGISRKELSYAIGIPVATIDRAIQRESEPTAKVAISISKFLKTNLEELLDIEEDINQQNYSSFEKVTDEERMQIKLYKKYSQIIELLETTNENRQDSIQKIIKDIVAIF